MLPFDSIYLLLIIPVLVGWFAQWRVRQIYNRYLRIPTRKGIKGIEVAKAIMSYHHLNIPVLQTGKPMLNYYNPQGKTLHLSERIAEHGSITSMGIVAHEVEHAIQDHQDCRFMVLRNKMAKLLAIMGQFSPLIFMWGIVFRNILFIYVGIILLFGMAVFAVLSLPVELNASSRAINTLRNTGIADQEELKMVRTVLRHAALTYFAAVAQRMGTFLFIVMILFLSHQM